MEQGTTLISASKLALSRELRRLARKHTLIKQGDSRWRCFVQGTEVNIEQDDDETFIVSSPLYSELESEAAVRNTYAFASHLEKFEHYLFVPHAIGERHGEAWERGTGMCVSRRFGSLSLHEGDLEQIIEESASQSESLHDVVAELSAGEMGLSGAVKTVDGLWQITAFVERTKKREGRNLVAVEEDDAPVPLTPVDLEELYPRERPAYLLDTKTVRLRTTTVGDAVGVLHAGGHAFPVEVSYRTPHFAEITIRVTEKVGDSCNRAKAALEVAKRSLEGDSSWEPLCVHPLYGRVVYAKSISSSDLTADCIDDLLERAAEFLADGDGALADLLGLESIGYDDGDARVRAAEFDQDIPDDMRYDFAWKCLNAGVAMVNGSDDTDAWLGGDRVSISLAPDYKHDKLFINACTWYTIPDASSAAAIERLSGSLGRKLFHGGADWTLGAGERGDIRRGDFLCWLFEYRLSSVLEESDGLEGILDHVEREVLLSRDTIEMLADGIISVRKAKQMIGMAHR